MLVNFDGIVPNKWYSDKKIMYFCAKKIAETSCSGDFINFV